MLDDEFVDTLRKACLQFIRKKDESTLLEIATAIRNTVSCSCCVNWPHSESSIGLTGLLVAGPNLGSCECVQKLINQDLRDEDYGMIIDTLCLDGKVERIPGFGCFASLCSLLVC